MVRRKTALALLALALALLFSGALLEAQSTVGPVLVADVDGVINPMSARYLERVVALGVARGAAAVVLRLDTPGGTDTAMREMVQSLLDAPLPVVVYVSPNGARATSAGMFITIAGHVAAMAPGTHIGAAHPVGLGVQSDVTLNEKATSDAAALAEGIAGLRGRNVEWVVQAVRENSSLVAAEALDQGVIDVVASDVGTLLRDIDGREVTVRDQSWTLHTANAPVQDVPMRWDERLIHVITHPDIAYLLLSVGTLLLLAELAQPGVGVGGVGAAVCYVLAMLALGGLPLNWAGVAMLGVSLVMLAVALHAGADITVTSAALIPFVLGSLMLYAPFKPASAAEPDLRVSLWLVAVMSLMIGGFILIVARAVVRATRLPPQSGPERLIGMRGLATTMLDPEGQVRVDLEDWSAVSTAGPVAAGQPVSVVAVSGVRLHVTPVDLNIEGE